MTYQIPPSILNPLLDPLKHLPLLIRLRTPAEGELADLIEDFSEGRIQFAFVKVKDPNTALPKSVLIAWCGGGVPERTKGYFTSHLAAVSKVLHGYHVQITARSDSDLEPQAIMQKVSDASGAKYTAGGSAPLASAAPPPVAKKPVFTPSTSSTSSSFNPLVAARNRRPANADDDGWGDDAPPVSRTQLEKVESAYKPTKVNMAELTGQKPAPSRFNGAAKQDDRPEVVKGAYQPVGKVDIAAIRAQAKNTQDDRPVPVKGSYEPVGKVDIAAIRAKAQRPAEPADDAEERPKSLADRSAAFQQSERLTELPKPKVAKKFGGAAFAGTKPPTPGALGLGSPTAPAPPPVGAASRTFADQGGKTPAQIWAEKKAKERGGAPASSTISPPPTSPIPPQQSGGEWKSGYSGKSWATVQTTNFGRGGVETQKTGATEQSEPEPEPEAPSSPAGGVSALRDRFKGAQPMGTAAHTSRGMPSAAEEEEEHAPPPLPSGTRPAGGFALPGLPSRPAAANEEEDEAPPIPSRDYEEEEEHSPVRVAMPVARGQEPELEPPAEQIPPRPIPTQHIEEELPKEEDIPQEEEAYDPRAASAAVAADSFSHAAVTDNQAGSGGGHRALAKYDYERAEDNELELTEGEYITDIEMVDDDWWMGRNSKGETGLFPSNYVELVGDEDEGAGHDTGATDQQEPAAAAAGGSAGSTATATYDYEAAEDNGRFLRAPPTRSKKHEGELQTPAKS